MSEGVMSYTRMQPVAELLDWLTTKRAAWQRAFLLVTSGPTAAVVCAVLHGLWVEKAEKRSFVVDDKLWRDVSLNCVQSMTLQQTAALTTSTTGQSYILCPNSVDIVDRCFLRPPLSYESTGSLRWPPGHILQFSPPPLLEKMWKLTLTSILLTSSD